MGRGDWEPEVSFFKLKSQDIVYSTTLTSNTLRSTVPPQRPFLLEDNLYEDNSRIARHINYPTVPPHSGQIIQQNTRRLCEFSIIFDDAGDSRWLPKGSNVLHIVTRG